MTSSYSQFLSSLAGGVTALRSRVAAGAVVGAIALGAVVVGAGTVSAAPSGASAAVAKPRSHSDAHGRKPGTPARATADAVISLAEKQVGITADPSGQTKFHQWYTSTPDARLTARRDGGSVADYNRAAWCDMFVSWVGAQAGVTDMGRDAYTVAHAKWFQKIKRWGEQPRPGAVVFYAWNGGGTDGIAHVGLVVKDNGDGTITTVEGNTTGDAVAKKVRSTSQVVGYGYPLYAG